jgi:spore maturation protein CgeB
MMLRSSQGDIDIGNEGNKSTYLRPSRNRDMSSLDIKANSRSCSNVLIKDTSRVESEERVL